MFPTCAYTYLPFFPITFQKKEKKKEVLVFTWFVEINKMGGWLFFLPCSLPKWERPSQIMEIS